MMKSLWKAASIAALSLVVSASAIAGPFTPPHAHPAGTVNPRKPLFAGNIIGNKRTHIYHMKGDPGALPAEQNRVYFRTEAQAIAAGYHRAGHGKPAPAHRMMGAPGHHTMMMPHHPMGHM